MCIILIAALVLFPDTAMDSAFRGYLLFVRNVFPALFPFAVCISFLKRNGSFDCNKQSGGIRGFFGIIFISILSGAPSGSLMIDAAYGDNGNGPLLPREKRSILSAFLNLSGPAFVLGTVCRNMLGSKSNSVLLLVAAAHYGTAAIMSLSYYLICCKNEIRTGKIEYQIETEEKKTFCQTLSKALLEACKTMIVIVANIVFFSVIAVFVNGLPFLRSIQPVIIRPITGMIEITAGINSIAELAIDYRFKLSLICFLLSFGGICVAMQVGSIVKTCIKEYLFAKLLLSLLSAVTCYTLFPVFLKHEQAAFSVNDISNVAIRFFSVGELALMVFMSSVAACLAAVFSARRTKS